MKYVLIILVLFVLAFSIGVTLSYYRQKRRWNVLAETFIEIFLNGQDKNNLQAFLSFNVSRVIKEMTVQDKSLESRDTNQFIKEFKRRGRMRISRLMSEKNPKMEIVALLEPFFDFCATEISKDRKAFAIDK